MRDHVLVDHDRVLPPPAASGPVSLALALAHAEQAVLDRLRPLLAETGLALEHWRVLAVLLDRPGQSMAALADQAFVAAASLTRHVDRLVEIGLVVRSIDPADRRRSVTALAPRGTAYARRLHDVELLARDEVLQRLFAAERRSSPA